MPTSLLLALAVSAGVAAGVFLDSAPLSLARWSVAAFGVAAFFCAARAWLQLARACLILTIAAAAVLIAADAQHRAIHTPLRQLQEDRLGGFSIDSTVTARNDTPVVIEGVLTADAIPLEGGASLKLFVTRASAGACLEPAEGGVSLTVLGQLADDGVRRWRAGRTIRTAAVLRRPARYLNAGVPDLERMMAQHGTSLVGTVKSAALIDIVAPGSWFDETAADVRSSVRHALNRHVGRYSVQSAAIAIAILIGDRGSLDPIVEQRLQEAGTYHVIAISGGNIAIVAGLVLAALWLLRIRDGWAAAAAVVILAAYAYTAGGGSSVLRATVMASIYLVLRIIDQRTAPLHAMSLTLAAVLIATPLAIADVGLWLTFGATAAIVAGAGLVRLPASPWLRAPVTLVVASLSAELALLPIVTFVFQRVTIAGLAANLVAIPCMAVAQVAAMATAAADAVSAEWLARVAGWITHAGVTGLINSAAILDVAPWLTWRVPSPALIVVIAYYACAIAYVRWRWPLAAACVVALLTWIIAAPQTWARQFGDGRLHVTMMDVGQGDAMLVTFPNGRTLMVDAGGVSVRGDFDIGDRVLGPALRHRGLGRIDYLAITHGDPDHIGGALSLVRDFAPREIWYGTYVNHHESSMQLQAMALYKRSTWRWLIAGDRLDLGGVELRVHHPPPEDWQRQKVRNDDSLVLELRYGQVSVLLTGDIGGDVESALLPALDLLPIVVLKSPHHGSGTSSSDAFVRALKPRVVLISCGRGNPYGHPVPQVLDRYNAIGAQIFRTDQSGQIELVTDGQAIETRTFIDTNTKDTKGTKTPLQVPRAPDAH